MFFSHKKSALTRQQQLASKPLRLVEGETATSDTGSRLTIKLNQKRATNWLLRMPPNATKTFEFDALGKLVWDHCDGKTSVQQIARKLARTYNISERESQVATEKFLTMLAKKGLIGAAVAMKKESEQ